METETPSDSKEICVLQKLIFWTTLISGSGENRNAPAAEFLLMTYMKSLSKWKMMTQNFTDLEVKPSSVEEVEGMGLFTKRPIAKDDAVVHYYGKLWKGWQFLAALRE